MDLHVIREGERTKVGAKATMNKSKLTHDLHVGM